MDNEFISERVILTLFEPEIFALDPVQDMNGGLEFFIDRKQ